MKRLIVGFGNTLRGEDAFGVDAILMLQNKALKNTTLLSAFQLTPEMALELLDYSHIIFIDTAFSPCCQYALACSLENAKGVTLSHHISAFHLIDILNTLYGHFPSFEIFSMLGNNFEAITNKIAYHQALEKTTQFLIHY
jgi:hydrogenase maturation protease